MREVAGVMGWVLEECDRGRELFAVEPSPRPGAHKHTLRRQRVLQNRPRGGKPYAITKRPPFFSGSLPRHLLGSPCPPPGRDISQGQRLVKRKGIIYLKVIQT